MSRTDDRMSRRAPPRDDAPRSEPGFRADPRLSRTPKGTGPVVEDADRPLHLSQDASRGGPSYFGWLVLGVVAALAAGGYAWYSRTPAPTQQPVASGYTTPMQAPGQGDAQTLGSAGQVTNPSAAGQPASSATGTGTTAGQDLNSVAVTATPAPHMVPPTPVQKAPTSISAFKPPATAPSAPKPAADHASPPPKQAQAAPVPPKHDVTPVAAPKDAAAALPKPQPQPTPAAATPAPQPAAAETSAPGPLAPEPTAADNAAPPLGANSITVNGLTYIEGQQPHALGTLTTTTPAAAASSAPTPLAPQPAAAPAPQTAPYTPPSDSSAPLANDVIVAPNGQLSVPAGH